MVLCSCRLLGEDRVMTLKFDDRMSAIIIYLAGQDDKYILRSNIESNGAETRPLLKFFGMSMLQLYNYLSDQQCQLQIAEEEGSITIKYQVTSLLTDTKQHIIRLPTYSYDVFPPKTSKVAARNFLARRAPSFTWEKQHIVEGIYEPLLLLENEESIGKVEGHQGWFFNKRKDLLQRVGHVDPFRKEDWEIKTHKFNVNLNRHHSEGPNRQKNIYALTFGLVHPDDYDGLKDELDKYICRTISVRVEGRKVYSHCMSQEEWLDFNESVQPESLQIYVAREKKEGLLRTKQIEMYLNYHKRINLFSEEVLNTYEKELERFNEFVIFIYFKRTFLHFNFTPTAS